MLGRWQRERGYTLVELLVVIAILGLVCGGIYTSFSRGEQESATRQRVMWMQQQARLAMESIERDLRMTGYGFINLGNMTINYYNNGAQQSLSIAEANNFSVPTDISDASGNRVANTDAVSIRFFNGTIDTTPSVSIYSAVPGGSSANTPVNSTTGMSVGDLILIYDPSDSAKPASVLQITGFDNGGGGFSGLSTRHSSGGNIFNPPNPAANLFPVGGYPIGSKVLDIGTSNLRLIRYYVDSNANLIRQVQDGITGAVSSRLVAGGIEDLQFKYYFADGTWRDDMGGGVGNLRAIRVSLIARTQYPDLKYAGDSYQLSGQAGNGVLRSGMGYRRMVMSTIVQLRNMSMTALPTP